jgi:hypothetical protein
MRPFDGTHAQYEHSRPTGGGLAIFTNRTGPFLMMYVECLKHSIHAASNVGSGNAAELASVSSKSSSRWPNKRRSGVFL